MFLKMKPISVIKANLGIEPNGRVQKYFTKRCAEHMDKYIPLDEGGLAYDNRIIKSDRIIYDTPYAHYMYEGKVMVDSETGSAWAKKDHTKVYNGNDINYSKSIARGHEFAGPHWDKRMWSAEQNEVIEEVQNYVNRGGK